MKGHFISNLTIPSVADFLLWLWKSIGLSLSAIKGYRSMLSSIFKFRLPELSTHHVLRSLLRSLSLEAPHKPLAPPPWDLDVVPKHLMPETYEPVRLKPFREVTEKTLFLVSFATAKRVGERQGLSRMISSHGNDLELSYMAHFVAKTERQDQS